MEPQMALLATENSLLTDVFLLNNPEFDTHVGVL